MAELEGHAFLLAMLLGNQNNNNGANGGNNNQNNNNPTAATITLHSHILEASYLKLDDHQGTARRLDTAFTPLSNTGSRLPGLTRSECDNFHKDGYLVLPNILSAHDTSILVQRARGVMGKIIARGSGIEQHVLSDKAERPSPYGRVLATFEKVNLSPSEPLTQPIARLGCGIHLLMPDFRELTHSDFHRSITKSLGYSNPCVTQSQIIVKSANRGTAISPHQDNCINFTDPLTSLTFWYALEDATLDNGCLCIAKGSHVLEPLRQRCIRDENGNPKLKTLEQPLWAKGTDRTRMEASPSEQIEYRYEPIEVNKGSLILFDGNLLHKSGRNRSGKGRMAYNFCVVEGDAYYADDSYLKPVDGGLHSL